MYRKFTGSHQDKLGALKVCYTMMMGHPGKKLLFMGQDFAQQNEWDFHKGLDWWLCDEEGHRDVMECYRELLHLYKDNAVLYDDGNPTSFEWVESGDVNRSIFAFIRRNPWNYNDGLLFVCNFTPTEYTNYGVGAPVAGEYEQIFSTYRAGDKQKYVSTKELCNGRENKLTFKLRPFEAVILKIPCTVQNVAKRRRWPKKGKDDGAKTD
jgi:1,4-alpha-glucan branching enzyme